MIHYLELFFPQHARKVERGGNWLNPWGLTKSCTNFGRAILTAHFSPLPSLEAPTWRLALGKLVVVLPSLELQPHRKLQVNLRRGVIRVPPASLGSPQTASPGAGLAVNPERYGQRRRRVRAALTLLPYLCPVPWGQSWRPTPALHSQHQPRRTWRPPCRPVLDRSVCWEDGQPRLPARACCLLPVSNTENCACASAILLAAPAYLHSRHTHTPLWCACVLLRGETLERDPGGVMGGFMLISSPDGSRMGVVRPSTFRAEEANGKTEGVWLCAPMANGCTSELWRVLRVGGSPL